MAGQQEEVYLLSAVRTPIGTLNGGLSTLKAHDLGSIVIQEAITRAGVRQEHITEVLMGQILTAGVSLLVPFPIRLPISSPYTHRMWSKPSSSGGHESRHP